MLSEREISAAVGRPAFGADGDKIGTVEAFFADDRTGAPTWAAVRTGLFGTRHSVVPVREATVDDGALHLPVTADAVRSAPPMNGDHLDPADEATLLQHYGLVETAPQASTGPRHAAPGDEDDPDQRATRARLVTYVVTDEVQITVPVRREEVRVEQVPVDADDVHGESLVPAGAADGPPDEIVLHTERPVVTVEVVPVERVHLVGGGEAADDQVERERIAGDAVSPPEVTPR
jgi:hypothetical protein